ncbi:ArsR/SmtB family transcription factor [Nonomuraea cavernae]|uniref:ArsR family transcriptional regulator n=1 Tax=Nonomuraea cavernae TaxID=2045107 RepID=A0A917ZCV5_9ACTN|nr:metalloregulator ArsR/SmtB family transcription factor [Nonomuraea cavernae]MCA2190458.1 metalloregulator ArsR/SmtB family transcription factor [Nonomuraea cavernae]GGO79577.1 ArsR family transcriptional regulator [Nonomuraea cavernae]
MDAVFKALADASRRELLDSLNRRNGQTLRELCAGLDMTRQAVTKHLSVLEAAGLVATARRGREKLHYLNSAPINEIAERWIDRYDRERARALADLKHALEGTAMSETTFVYVTYIKTTPDRLWEALTTPAFISRYFDDSGPRSEWTPGAPIAWKADTGREFRDWGQRVLEAEPGKRLSYTWHNYEQELADMFGWSDEKLAELRKEPISTVTFEIEPAGEGTVKLTVTHDGFAPGSEMLKGVSQGWPAILSNLKTLLESDQTLAFG